MPRPDLGLLTRRQTLCGLGASLGAVALTDLLAREGGAANVGPADAKPKPMHPPKAKRVIMLFMEGGPSQVDTFDPKPTLNRLHKTESTRTDGLATGERFYVGSPFGARQVGDNGLWMSDRWEHLAAPDVANELCNYRGLQAESLNHPEALFHMNTGSRLGADPAVGAWANYGLGSLNENLPSYVVMTELAAPQGGAGNWSNGFLPPEYRGTRLRPVGSPILDLDAPPHRSRDHQRRMLDELAALNAGHPAADEDPRLAARTAGYELAFRMQADVPEAVDLAAETAETRALYGLDRKETKTFGKQCLTARRLIERG
ncbi:DUF1501 domain-containing protein, partial [Alienimonas sp. DA493]|uniref:DUF1501 domain-containing protein n=1 Tax=Alienimonas sp. DA493 TaxID=3373605 RepID=UPI0037549865